MQNLIQALKFLMKLSFFITLVSSYNLWLLCALSLVSLKVKGANHTKVLISKAFRYSINAGNRYLNQNRLIARSLLSDASKISEIFQFLISNS